MNINEEIYEEVFMVKDNDPSDRRLVDFEEFMEMTRTLPLTKRDASELTMQLYCPIQDATFLLVGEYRYALDIPELGRDRYRDPDVEEYLAYNDFPFALDHEQVVEFIEKNVAE